MASLGIPSNTIEILKKYNFSFQKKFGQNFLIDTHVLEKIIEESEIDYINVFFPAMMCSILYVWVSHGKKETPEQLLTIFKKISLWGK